MCLSDNTCGRCLVFFFVSLVLFFCWVFITADYVRLAEDMDPPLVLETNRLPLLSPDRKAIYVVSEEGLPIAHNFVLRNPSIPIEKIVYRKPGPNSTLHIYPIQRDALLATNHDFSKYDLPGLCAFIFVLLFVSIAMYVYMCKGLCWTLSFHGSRRSRCDSCCDGLFDTSVDMLDDPFDTPLDSPLGSPVKPKKAKLDKCFDDVEDPLLMA